MRNLLSTALIAVFLAGCQSTPTTESAAPIDDKSATATTPGASTGGTSGTGVSGTSIGGSNPLRDPNNILSKRSVYFDFDSYVVRDEFKPLVEAHGRYLQSNRNARMTIQGNADERGSHEYNLALGQRRADAVKRMMVLLGAGEAQVETVSFGKEKPRNQGHDEVAWAENRRDDMVYAGE
ncbi:MAG TPA: peptidoglycan-associated lipoprotein Pal [Casimicrobiaceae bacterium]|jgi:peptidoglycan-associated lipoprotein